MAENVPKLMTNTKPQIQEAQRISSTINTKKATSKNIIFKLQEAQRKRENLERSQGKTTFYHTGQGYEVQLYEAI